MKSAKSLLLAAACALLPVQTVLAGDKTKSAVLDCARESLAAAIQKLDRSIANVLEFEGNCVEDIVIEGHTNLTLRGSNGASITATSIDLDPGDGENNIPSGEGNSTTALEIYRSKVTIESVTFKGGKWGALCSQRSDCVFRDVSVVGGWNGLAVQTQSALDLFGSGSITGSLGIGIGVFGASSLTTQPNWYGGLDWEELGYEISGHGWSGVVAQDGSFYRSDNAVVTGNGTGVTIRRGAVAKLYAGKGTPGIHDNGQGVDIYSNSTADIDTPIKFNKWRGLGIGALTTARVQTGDGQFDGNGIDVECYDDTARSPVCPAEPPAE